MKKALIAFLSLIGVTSPGLALADYTWTPMVSSTMFDGIRADMLVAVSGILGLALIVFGLAMLMRVTGR